MKFPKTNTQPASPNGQGNTAPFRGGNRAGQPDNFDRPQQNQFWSGLEKALDVIHDLIGTIPYLLLWLTGKGAGIIFGVCVLYFFALSAENYWQAIPGGSANPSFILKPFVNDDADFFNVFVAVTSGSFWMAAILSTSVQAVQAMLLRDIEISKAKAELEEVAGYTVPDKNPKGLEIAEVRRVRLKTAGMLEVRKKGATIIGIYLVDFITSYNNFPLLDPLLDGTFGQFGINLTWFLLSVFGAELAGSMFLGAIANRK